MHSFHPMSQREQNDHFLINYTKYQKKNMEFAFVGEFTVGLFSNKLLVPQKTKMKCFECVWRLETTR